MTIERLTDEQIAALRDGTEGVTLGPWHWVNPDNDEPWDGEAYANPASLRTVAEFAERKDGTPYNGMTLPRFVLEAEELHEGNAADAAHIARCDPDTIRALATEVLESREALAAKDREIERLTSARDAAIVALGEWARKAGALETRVAKLEEALEDVVEECAGGAQ